MRIPIAVLDKDIEFTNRMKGYFQANYSKQVSLSIFSKEDLFIEEARKKNFGLLIVAEELSEVCAKLPESTKSVILTSGSESGSDGTDSIFRYQSMVNFYKQVLGFCAESRLDLKLNSEGKGSKIIMFTSAQGGAGTSLVAAAFALNMAGKGKKVLYLNLETLGNTDMYFKSDGSGSFSDVIYALKSSGVNFQIKLESLIRRDPSGVEYIKSCKNVVDMQELKDNEMRRLLETIQGSGNYDTIVIDYSAAFDTRQFVLMNEFSDTIFYIRDDSGIGKQKFWSFLKALDVCEKREKTEVRRKMLLIKNNIRKNAELSDVEEIPIEVFGYVWHIEGSISRLLAGSIACMEVFEQL